MHSVADDDDDAGEAVGAFVVEAVEAVAVFVVEAVGVFVVDAEVLAAPGIVILEAT